MLRDVAISLFGVYSPIDGQADWSYIASVLVFVVILYGVFKVMGGLFRR